MLHDIICIFKKEFGSYFRTKLAYFILMIYAVLSSLIAFYTGNYFELNNFNLFSLFYFQPDIFAILVPALTMKVWADERRFGTLELILAQPLSYTSLVIGKFMAAWLFCGLMLILTTSLWATTSFLSTTDSLNIFSNYLACFLVAGAICAVGCAVSSFNSNPILAYIIAVFVVWLLKLSNFDYLLKAAKLSNELLVRISQSLNFNYHFENIISGQVTSGNLIYFASIIVFALWLNVVSIEYKRG